ncbi:MAG: hypothetical protein PWR01_3164 [Clostridiales bacterium]|jgi:drug/metabolite transporter (DMT)-like permease|nr:hypothetical protein [Clostridiales bacterium]MDN5282091.1 hypothetical protein [Candidatus Ozemobacter sp.]
MLIKFAPLLLVICGILRSTDLYFRTPVVATLPVITLITWEHLINLVVVSPILIYNFRQYFKFRLKDFFLFIFIGCGASALGILCFTQAFLYINPALAVLLQKLQPLMTIFMGAFILRERIERRFFLWALIAIIASYFVSFGLADPFSGEWRKVAIGAGYAVLAAFFWGSGTIWGKILLERFSQLFVMSNRFLFGAIFTLIISHLFGNGFQAEVVFSPEKPLITSIIYMAIISGFFATSFFYVGLKWVKASLASILELVFPVSSVLIMWWSFNRPLTTAQIIAGIVLFTAMYKINSLNRNEDEIDTEPDSELEPQKN